MSRWYKRAIKKFIKGKYPCVIPNWGTKSIENGRLWSTERSYAKYWGKNDIHLLFYLPELDLRQIQGSFNSILLPDQATSVNERQGGVTLEVQHYNQFYGVRKRMETDEFVQLWTAMFEFCLTSDGWRDDKRRYTNNMSKLWMSLIGLPGFVTSLWDDNDSPVIEKMVKYIDRVSVYIMTSDHEATNFMAWLCETSAKGIRRQLLKSVAKVGLSESEYWWSTDLTKRMARYLSLVWTEHGQSIERDDEEKKIFHDLVHKAAQTQDGLAMELQSRLASRE